MEIIGMVSGALLMATDPSSADAWNQCIDTTVSNVEWGGCGDTYLKRLDDELNVAWKKANASLDEQSRTQLLQEQRAWIKFRDASCQYYANGSFGREGQVLHFFACRGAVVAARISDLKGIYELTHEDSR